ncbi:MAG: error-prone DNA polymerase [Gammaproteobacteria bacterium]|nr:error-prone DNA polymerase [Gammaproteobacteria bacterium]
MGSGGLHGWKMRYAELHCLSHFSFQRGASSPRELVQRAKSLGYQALALTDECSFAGLVEAHCAAREAGLKLIVGMEVTFVEGPKCVLLACHAEGYAGLTALITRGRGSAKGTYHLSVHDALDLRDCLLLWCASDATGEAVRPLAAAFAARFWILAELHRTAADARHRRCLTAWSAEFHRPVVAAGDVHMHVRGRRALQDVMTAIRLKVPVSEAGYALFQNGERHLRPLASLEALYPPSWLAETQVVAGLCSFHLDELRYGYPQAAPTPGRSVRKLVRSTIRGLRERYPGGVPASVRTLAAHELRLIAELAYADYFLTVHDLVTFARSRGILCQGRGSAANSVVCYALGITSVDPSRMEVLFERFVSRERDEPPDIDIDFEHERREEVIQYLYDRYGRTHAAMTGSAITYRARSAVRDVARALGWEPALVDRLAGILSWWDGADVLEKRLADHHYDPNARAFRQLAGLVRDLVGRPRHWSQHTGGMVLSREPLSRLVPVERAAMPGRTVLQWTKDDLDVMRIMKVDCLGLGILTVLRKAFAMMQMYGLGPGDLASIPAEDPVVFRMIASADTVGVFQIESRAQMALLPRLKPRSFYDLVIQVAIVRPGPIQGRMVHPYLRRRAGKETVTYPDAVIEQVLGRTLGVPLFQEQVIKLAVVAAGFSPGEADGLRRSMAAWHHEGDLAAFRERLCEGMRARGYSSSYASEIYAQIKGFGAYGFPESHAASFALLAYASAWLKCYVPDVYLCAMLNSQPLGFYAPAQLIADARRHGVRILPPDICHSGRDTQLVVDGRERVVRLGLGLVRHLSAAGNAAIGRVCHRHTRTADEIVRAAGLSRTDVVALARAGALRASGSRSQALWKGLGVMPPLDLFDETEGPDRRWPSLGHAGEVAADYRSLGFSLQGHPLTFLRRWAPETLPIASLGGHRSGAQVAISGLVISRQRPQSAAGLVFLLVEDDTGTANLIIKPEIGERYRAQVLGARGLVARGRLERTKEGVQHILVGALEDLVCG